MGYVEIKRRVGVCRVIIEAFYLLGDNIGDHLVIDRNHIRAVQNSLLYFFIQFLCSGVAAHNSCQKWRTTHVKAYLCI